MKIYTKTGDAGQTGLWGGLRVPKDHPRVAAYGDVDELNCQLGCALAALGKSPLRAVFERVQSELFIVGALLASPAAQLKKLKPPFDQGLPRSAVDRLEAEIDAWTSGLAPMTHFIMPGGSPAGAQLHVARAVCRRAERAAASLAKREPLPDNVLIYLNRLSDHLFTAARWANARAKAPETTWRGLSKRS